MIFSLLSCTTPAEQEPVSFEHSYAAIAYVSMDYAIGTLSIVDLDDYTLQESISTVSGDPLIFFEEDLLWQLNRYQYDTLRKYDPADLSAPIAEISIRPEGVSSANPQDLHFCADKLFVSLYDHNAILVVDPETLVTVNEIDLSHLIIDADEDGLLELSDMVVLDETLFVAGQGLNRQAGWTAQGSLIAQIDCNSEALITSQYVGKNVRIFDTDSPDLIFSSEAWDSNSAGIYTLNIGESPRALVLSEDDFGIEHFVSKDEYVVFSTLSADYSEYQLYCGPPDDLKLMTTTQAFVTEIAQHHDEAWVATHWGWNNPEEQTPGITRYHIPTCSPIDQPIVGSLAPYSIAFVDDEKPN